MAKKHEVRISIQTGNGAVLANATLTEAQAKKVRGPHWQELVWEFPMPQNKSSNNNNHKEVK